MTVAILGLGNMGKGLAKRLAGKTELVLGTRDAEGNAEFAKSIGASATSFAAAAAAADIVFVALPYDAALDVAALPELAGKVVVDMSNPVTPDFSGLKLGHTTSAAEEIQKVAATSKVVKGFNTIFASLLSAPETATAAVPVFLAGDDAAAVDQVAEIVKLAGFDVDKVGGLDGARLLEPVGMLNIRMGYGLGRGTSIAPAWLSIAA